jgi:hypothetical protein
VQQKALRLSALRSPSPARAAGALEEITVSRIDGDHGRPYFPHIFV